MIKGVHAMFYSSKTDELRAFIKDKLRLRHTDVGHGWLIFDLDEVDLGCHPTEGQPASGTHDISFYTDDLQKTVADMRSRGVQFDDEIADRGFGYVVHLTMPGDVKVQIYQPKYQKRPRKSAPTKKSAAKKNAPTKKSAAKKNATKKPAKKKGAKARK
jgi:hypothetical protein